MTLTFDASTATVLQTGNWQCSAAAAAWLLEALGIGASQDDVVAALGPNRIDPAVGLHDASGAGLSAMLADYGVSSNHARVSYDDAYGLASSGPLLLGGLGWDHWTAVRGIDGDTLALANPAPGWEGVGTSLSRAQFSRLGPFYAVWPTDAVPAAAPADGGAVGVGGGVNLPQWWELAAGALALLWSLDLLP